MVQQFGVSAVWTEMISADGLVTAGKRFRTMELSGHRVPTVFQLYGHDPAVLAHAAARLQEYGAAAVDLNMGCPARKVVGRGEGAALMKDLPHAARIVGAVRERLGLDVALTVKIRSGWDDDETIAPVLAKMIEAEGADGIVVHARSRAKRHSGPASLEVVAAVKDAVKVPVIGNGGIVTPTDALEMTARSGCDGVMVGRGALGRPWLPGKILSLLSSRSFPCRTTTTVSDVIDRHFRYQLQWVAPSVAVRRMRKHLVWYSAGFPEAARFRRQVLHLDDVTRVMEAVRNFFGKVVVA
jgi:nifR3 family TIM-barrel protein